MSKNIRKLEAITFLKGLAMLSVILTHSHQMFELPMYLQLIPRFGQMGCQGFFVLSCFCLCQSYENKCYDLLSFYEKRFKSISIGYWLTILLSITLALFSIHFIGDNIFNTSVKSVDIFENLIFIHGLIPLGGGNNNVVRGGWYVGTIMIFYLLFPALYGLFQKSNKKQYFHYGVFVVTTIILVVFLLIDDRFAVKRNSFLYFSFINQLSSFSIGFYLYYSFKMGTKIYNLLLKGILSILASFILFFIETPLTYIIAPFLFSVGFFYLALWILNNYPQKDFMGSRVVLLFGNNSYAIYLIHPYLAFDVSKLVISVFNISQTLLYFVWQPILFLLILTVGCGYNKILNNVKKLVYET